MNQTQEPWRVSVSSHGFSTVSAPPPPHFTSSYPPRPRKTDQRSIAGYDILSEAGVRKIQYQQEDASVDSPNHALCPKTAEYLVVYQVGIGAGPFCDS